jgi:hypothetical protein
MLDVLKNLSQPRAAPRLHLYAAARNAGCHKTSQNSLRSAEEQGRLASGREAKGQDEDASVEVMRNHSIPLRLIGH